MFIQFLELFFMLTDIAFLGVFIVILTLSFKRTKKAD